MEKGRVNSASSGARRIQYVDERGKEEILNDALREGDIGGQKGQVVGSGPQKKHDGERRIELFGVDVSLTGSQR